jgi:hypothetical protein
MSKCHALEQVSGFIYDALNEDDVSPEDVTEEIKVVLLEGINHHRTMLEKFERLYSYFGD